MIFFQDESINQPKPTKAKKNGRELLIGRNSDTDKKFNYNLASIFSTVDRFFEAQINR